MKEKDNKSRTSTSQKQKQKEEQIKKNGNKELAKVKYAFVLLFFLMIGYAIYFQEFRSRAIINSPYNVRLDSLADRIIRGQITDDAGNVLARTRVEEDGTETRVYPYGNLYAHVVGYDCYGKSGIESIENFNLLTSDAPIYEKVFRTLFNQKNIGNNVITTLNTTLQQAAYDALGDEKGAVVVIDVETGKILTMVSKPDFDPNTLLTDWEDITEGSEGILLNRVTQGAYTPGSVFKLVTTLAYLRENSNYTEYLYECEGEIAHAGVTIHCAKNRVHGKVDLYESFARSCNSSYCNIGLNLNFEKYKQTAQDLLFNKKLPCVFECTKSSFVLAADSTVAEIMMTSFGQGKTQVSPYHMALIAAAIGNGGILMEPYVVDEVINYKGSLVEKRMPKKYTSLMSSSEAGILKGLMQEVVESGTGAALKNEVYTVAGKTGTAEYSTDKEKVHSWFMGFTNVDNPEIAISVVVEGTDDDGVSAVSVAKKVFDAYYK